jgi:Uma2 family endonuclease
VVSTAPAPPRPLSLDEWAGLEEDEPGEFVDGWLAEEEVPDLAHESVVAWLIGVLRAWLIARGGFVFGSEAKFALSGSRGRKPDVTAYLPGRTGLPRRGVVRVPPDIAVEVLSEAPRDARRDRIEKPDEYARFGIHWYWLIDPHARTFEVFELGADGRYVRALAASSGCLRIPRCDGLELDLDQLWAEIDRLEEG